MLEEAISNIRSAIEAGRTDILRTLIEACEQCEQADTEHVTKDRVLSGLWMAEGTLLHLATRLGRPDVVRALLYAGADPGVQNQDGDTPVHLSASDTMRSVYTDELFKATAQSNEGRVCQLLAAGLGINAWDSPHSRNTPLHWAANFADRDMVSCLTDRGAHVNAVNAEGATPLHDAVRRGRLDVIEELLLSGANPLARATEGKYAQRSPADLAVDNAEVTALLARFRAASETSRGEGDGAPGIERKVSQVSDDRRASVMTSRSAGDHHGITASRLDGLDSVTSDRLRTVSRLDSVGSMTSLISDETIRSEAGSLMVSPHKLHLSPPHQHKHEWYAADLRPVRPLVTDARLHLLWPLPRRIQQMDGGTFTAPTDTISVAVSRSTTVGVHSILDAWDVFRADFTALGYSVKMAGVQGRAGTPVEATVVCTVSDRITCTPESYSLTVAEKQVRIVCGDLSGLRYGVTGLLQLLRLLAGGAAWPQLAITDAPRLQHRALLVDLSPHGRVPKLESLCFLVDSMAELKLNQLHLFQRFGAAATHLPYTAPELVSLDRYCSDRGIAVVPALEVSPGTPPEALVSARPDMDAFVGCFADVRHVHLGPHLTALVCPLHNNTPPSEKAPPPGSAQLSRSPPSLLGAVPIPEGAVPLLCANSVQGREGTLPADVVLVQYGFQADYDFSEPAQMSLRAGVPLMTAAGTAAWGSLAGCPEATVHNAVHAARAADEMMGVGMVVADWRADGGLGQSVFSLPGLVAAAGFAWNPDTPSEFVHSSLADLLSCHVLRDASGVLGKALVELGRAETACLRAARGQDLLSLASLPPTEGSTLQRLLVDPDTVPLESVSMETVNKTMRRVRHCLSSLSKAQPTHPEGDRLVKEVHMTCELMIIATKIARALVSMGTNPHSNLGYQVINVGVSNLAPTFCTDTANKLLTLVDQYRALWLERHLPAGLQSSLLVLSGLLQKLIPETAQNGL